MANNFELDLAGQSIIWTDHQFPEVIDACALFGSSFVLWIFGTIEESRKGLNLEPLYLDDYCFYAFVPVRNLDNAIPVVNTHIAE
jgi:hypothetical protein